MFILPSLQALKIFECASRHDSFTQAADELGISQSAVSQHINNLEIRVGFKVFNRESKCIILTPSGRALLTSVTVNLHHIQQTIEIERRKKHSNELVISTPPGFAIRWLFPRLLAFNQAFEHIKVTVNTVSDPLNFNLYHANVGLFYGEKDIEYVKSEALFEEHLFPVCSPDFMHQHNLQPPLNLKALKKLMTLPLLGEESTQHNRDTWRDWAQSQNLSFSNKQPLRQSLSNITLQLAELGHGVAMGRTSLVMDALSRGQLVALTRAEIDNPCHYHVVHNPMMPISDSLATFITWLQEEVKAISVAAPN
ncbi:LysR substrate-binding domain-containing protein [uncultured Shewanella sp.]|uniref:LysR substrate-binding domain-containing protein n=1 Tax=uncultured Shewanella sp. TaxID=173975 RepID=UPI00263980A5|nr:LysR substrate-binding domain-containing protein [uncultured Shewanella sp.]